MCKCVCVCVFLVPVCVHVAPRVCAFARVHGWKCASPRGVDTRLGFLMQGPHPTRCPRCALSSMQMQDMYARHEPYAQLPSQAQATHKHGAFICACLLTSSHNNIDPQRNMISLAESRLISEKPAFTWCTVTGAYRLRVTCTSTGRFRALRFSCTITQLRKNVGLVRNSLRPWWLPSGPTLPCVSRLAGRGSAYR